MTIEDAKSKHEADCEYGYGVMSNHDDIIDEVFDDFKKPSALLELLKEQERLLLDIYYDAFIEEFIKGDVMDFYKWSFSSETLEYTWCNMDGCHITSSIPINEWFAFSNQA